MLYPLGTLGNARCIWFDCISVQVCCVSNCVFIYAATCLDQVSLGKEHLTIKSQKLKEPIWVDNNIQLNSYIFDCFVYILLQNHTYQYNITCIYTILKNKPQNRFRLCLWFAEWVLIFTTSLKCFQFLFLRIWFMQQGWPSLPFINKV